MTAAIILGMPGRGHLPRVGSQLAGSDAHRDYTETKSVHSEWKVTHGNSGERRSHLLGICPSACSRTSPQICWGPPHSGRRGRHLRPARLAEARAAERELVAARPGFTVSAWVRTQVCSDTEQLAADIASLRAALGASAHFRRVRVSCRATVVMSMMLPWCARPRRCCTWHSNVLVLPHQPGVVGR